MGKNKSVVWLAAVAMVISLVAAPAMADDGKAALDHIPQETMLVVAINLERLKGSSLYKDAIGMVMADASAAADFEKLKKATGFDIESDLDGLVIAAAADFESSEQFLLIAKGKFDETKFIDFAKSEGAKITKGEHNSTTFYDVDDDAAMVFSGDYLMIGPKPAIKAAIDTKKDKSVKSVKDSALAKLWDAADTGKDLWFAMELPESFKKEVAKGLKGEIDKDAMGDVEWVYGSLDLQAGLVLDIVVGTSEAKFASALASMAQKGLADAAKDPNVAQLGLAGAISNTKVEAADKNLAVVVKLSEDELNKIKGMLGAMMGGGF